MLYPESKRTATDPGLDRICKAAVKYDLPLNMLCWGNVATGAARDRLSAALVAAHDAHRHALPVLIAQALPSAISGPDTASLLVRLAAVPDTIVATAATDVYAFGHVLYRMLTGAAPFRAESMRELLIAQLAGAHALSWAVGAYLPVSTTAPIWVGGLVKWFAERKRTQAAAGQKPA